MKPLAIVAVALLASTAVARAQFTNHKPPTDDVPSGNGWYECSIVRQEPQPRRDRDPVYKIHVGIFLANGNGPIEAFQVYHDEVGSNRSYDRSKQYTDISISQTGKLQWNWTGFDYPKIMSGSLWWNQTDGWMYQETLYDRPFHVIYRMLADCHKTEYE